ncbi:MAG: hypothetical protein ACI9TY_001180 [Alphaproteobacteria bacterium]|jgi:hypothetical protein
MKNLFLITLLALSVTACGGSDDKKEEPVTSPVVVEPEVPVEETREEMIERELELPPEPDKEVNDSTVEGVDSNANGIRDDIERANAFEFYGDKRKLSVANEIARIQREKIINIDDIDSLSKLHIDSAALITCKLKTLTLEEQSKLALRGKYESQNRIDFYKKIKL